jgi:hypothetical protein
MTIAGRVAPGKGSRGRMVGRAVAKKHEREKAGAKHDG